MEQFSALRLFISVVDAGGFSAAGEVMGVSTSVVSRQIAALEAELGVRLLKRSTRTVELTEVGTTYLSRVRRLLLELDEANRSLKTPAAEAAGNLRIAAPTAIGLSLIAPAIADFMATNPHVAIHLDLADRRVDPDEENYDLVLRVDEAGHKLAQIEEGLFASPAYIAHHGRPHGPTDLGKHRALYGAHQQNWNLRGGIFEKPTLKFSANRLEALKTLCLAGQGIALLPLFLVRQEIDRGELVQLLDGFEPKASPLAMIISPLRSETAASRLFQSHLESRIKRLRL
jgi:DNA-binding transcriptional LysR family regulator